MREKSKKNQERLGVMIWVKMEFNMQRQNIALLKKGLAQKALDVWLIFTLKQDEPINFANTLLTRWGCQLLGILGTEVSIIMILRKGTSLTLTLTLIGKHHNDSSKRNKSKLHLFACEIRLEIDATPWREGKAGLSINIKEPAFFHRSIHSLEDDSLHEFSEGSGGGGGERGGREDV